MITSVNLSDVLEWDLTDSNGTQILLVNPTILPNEKPHGGRIRECQQQGPGVISFEKVKK
jgi:hypothetical protein